MIVILNQQPDYFDTEQRKQTSFNFQLNIDFVVAFPTLTQNLFFKVQNQTFLCTFLVKYLPVTKIQRTKVILGGRNHLFASIRTSGVYTCQSITFASSEICITHGGVRYFAKGNATFSSANQLPL